MIAHISGHLAEVFQQQCVVLTPGGVGYRINLPRHTWETLPERGTEVQFYTAMLVREDAQELYGFATFEERQTFDILRGITKIGPKAALAILSAHRPMELYDIVCQENLAALKCIPGIGAKTAQHLLLELRYKLQPLAAVQTTTPAASSAPTGRDVVAALLNLGYSEPECLPVVREIFAQEPDLDVATAIRFALKALASGKKS